MRSYGEFQISNERNNEKVFEIAGLISNMLFAIIAFPLFIWEVYCFAFLLVDDIPEYILIILGIGMLLKYPFFILQVTIMIKYKGSHQISSNTQRLFTILMLFITCFYMLFSSFIWIIMYKSYGPDFVKIFLNSYSLTIYIYLLSSISTLLFVHSLQPSYVYQYFQECSFKARNYLNLEK